jgi:hypothetical protein
VSIYCGAQVATKAVAARAGRPLALGVAVTGLLERLRTALVIVKPETVIAWHRRGLRFFWTWKSRRRRGRPTVPADVRALIRTMAQTNPLWGAPRIHGELLKLGMNVSQATVAKYMGRRRQPPSQTWRTFLTNHLGQVMAADFFVVPTATCRLLFVLVILAHERRRVVHVAVTDHPSAAWTIQQLREAFPWDSAPRYLIRDRDHAFDGWAHAAKAMGLEEVLTASRSPWQNAYAERFIGSARRVPRSRHRLQRDGTPAADEAVLRLLRTITHSPIAEQGRTDPSHDRCAGRWSRRGYPASRRIASPVRTAGGLTQTAISHSPA